MLSQLKTSADKFAMMMISSWTLANILPVGVVEWLCYSSHCGFVTLDCDMREGKHYCHFALLPCWRDGLENTVFLSAVMKHSEKQLCVVRVVLLWLHKKHTASWYKFKSQRDLIIEQTQSSACLIMCTRVSTEACVDKGNE